MPVLAGTKILTKHADIDDICDARTKHNMSIRYSQNVANLYVKCGIYEKILSRIIQPA